MKPAFLKRPLLAGLGGVAILVGAIFAGQGLNLIPGSFMTGDPKWFIIGALGVLAGLLLILVSLDRDKKRARETPPG